jgi:hypothetical protein
VQIGLFRLWETFLVLNAGTRRHRHQRRG